MTSAFSASIFASAPSEHAVLIATPRADEPQSDYLGPSAQSLPLQPPSEPPLLQPQPYPQPGYTRHCRECHAMRIPDLFMAIACPCVPAAQIASAVGKSYQWTLLLYGGLYAASGFCFLYAFWNALAFCAVWQFKWCGGGAFVETFFVILVQLDLDTGRVANDSFARRYQVHGGTLVLCLGLEWLLVAYIYYLRFQWSHYLQREDRGCTDVCAAAYCGCCVLAEMASDVKRQSTAMGCMGAVDTIPPYGAEDGVEVQYKLPMGCERWPI